MHPALQSSADRDASPTETQKAAFPWARDNRRSQSLRPPHGRRRTQADTTSSPPSRSSPCISASVNLKPLAVFRRALRPAQHEISAQPPDASRASTSSTTKREPSFHVPPEIASSLHHAVVRHSSDCHRRPEPEAASTTDRLRRNHSRDALR